MQTLPEDKSVRNAYAVAYAGFRIAQTIQIAGLRTSIESNSLRILTSALEGNPAIQLEAINDLETILGFGRDTGHIHPLTAELLFAELGKLKANPAKKQVIAGLVAESGNICIEPPMLNREDIFPADDQTETVDFKPVLSNVFLDSSKAGEGTADSQDSGLIEEKEEASVSQEVYAIRKSAILEKIRQSGNCRIRDLQDIAGNISERTLRYCLSRMLQEGLIERIGNSGPATYYRLRENGTAAPSGAAA